MIHVPMKSTVPYNKQTVVSINQSKVRGAHSSRNIADLNHQSDAEQRSSGTVSRPVNTAAQHVTQSIPSDPGVPYQPIPPLLHEVQKGQKVPLAICSADQLKVCMGWNVLNPHCDVDVSAFMLDASGKVPGDDWFVFYGQTQSPDHSTVFSESSVQDREMISIDLSKLHPAVAKIVFVLTIHEALEKKLNFSMIQDAYIRLLDFSSNTELVSFKMTEYYSNVTSMMIGELYLHNGNWKFNAIGNGVARDLAGLCELYGVQVV